MASGLLYSLRSPTTSLPAKLALAAAAQADSPSSLVSSQLRDWVLDVFLRARSSKASDDAADILLNKQPWAILVASLDSATGSSPSPTLPTFVAFVTSYSAAPNARTALLTSVLGAFKKLAGAAMKKATVDAVLDGYAALLKASVLVMARRGSDVELWDELAELWMKAFRAVADSGKGSKKIALHTLANLPSILPLLPLLTPTGSFRSALLQTVQFTLFNIDNLRRGIARETYNAGSTSTVPDETSESASSELLNALRALYPTIAAPVNSALPTLFELYRTALATHATALFPLPAKTSFPTASAYRSATELHSLQKRRALAAGWVRGVVSLLDWSANAPGEGKVECLAKTLEEVEYGDLFREGRGEGWYGILESIVAGAIAKLQPTTANDALLSLFSSIARLSFTSLEPSLATVLATLAASPPSSASTDSASFTFLTVVLTHHSRSHSLPSLLLRLFTALSTAAALPANVLTSHEFSAALSKALAALVGLSVRSSWTELVASLGVSPSPIAEVEEKEGEQEDDEGISRKKKRRKVDAAGSVEGAEARVRLLRVFVRAMPSPVPLDLFEAFRSGTVDPAVKDLAKGKAVGLGSEILGVRYAMLERLRLEGIEESEWDLGRKRRDGLVELLRTSPAGEVVLEITRTLLQSLVPATTEEEAQSILAAILERLDSEEVAPWSGHAHGMSSGELPPALWELVSRRWLQAFETCGSTQQLEQIAKVVVRSMNVPESPRQIAFEATTARLLRRADFYELRRLQSSIHTALLARVTLPSLSSPIEVLASLSAKKLPKPLRSLQPESVLAAVATFDRITSLVPTEYLGKGLRNDLIDRAFALDVWVTGGKLEIPEEEDAKVALVLRSFILLAAAEGASLTDGPAILAHLVKGTSTIDDAKTEATIAVYRHFVKSSILSFKTHNSPASLEAYLTAFDNPLALLAKRSKKAVASLTCEELAFFAFCDVVSTVLGQFASVPESLQVALRRASEASSKPFGKTLTATAGWLAASPEAVWQCADLLNACRLFWQFKDWIAGGENDQVEAFASFAQSVLGVLVTLTASSTAVLERQPNSLRTCLAVLELLGFRIARLRELSDPEKHSTLPFETFLACHLAFRQGLSTVAGASKALLGNLKRATASSTLREYAAALNDISAVIGQVVGGESASQNPASLEPALEVALVLLRDGPDGSSRLSTSCLSDLLGHLTLFLSRSSALEGTPELGAAVAESWLVVSTFLEGICGERPLLLSRTNVSSVLSLVARMLQPSGQQTSASSDATYVPTPASITSALWISLVTTVDTLVRHRKDHISPLFPHLVATLGPMLSSLRRAGFGTTGSTSIEDGEASVAVGRRAEREARATFPFWVWDGGARAMGRPEAKAVGRLLASLTAKTTATLALKRKRGAAPAGEKDVAGAASGQTASLAAPLSKHAPFILLPYLRACVNVVAPIPSALRSELQGGWFEVMDAMGKWEREALMKGFLSDDEEAERGVLRGMWRTWEKERYRG